MREKYDEQYYSKKFAQQLPNIDLLPGEILIHCLDKKSFKGRFYIPQWAVSNKGRCWSIWKGDWLTPLLWGNNNRYWCLSYQRDGKLIHIKVSWLVANYFCDKTPVNLFGEDGIDVHHFITISIPNEIKYSRDRNEKIKSCMEFNNADNLSYERSDFHREVIHTFMKGKTEAGVNVIDPDNAFLYNLIKGLSDVDSADKAIRSEYGNDGTQTLKIKVGWHTAS